MSGFDILDVGSREGLKSDSSTLEGNLAWSADRMGVFATHQLTGHPHNCPICSVVDQEPSCKACRRGIGSSRGDDDILSGMDCSEISAWTGEWVPIRTLSLIWSRPDANR